MPEVVKKKLLDFSNIQFKVNWASGLTLVSLLVYAITMYLDNKGLQGEIDGLKDNNKSLSSTVKALSETVNVLKGSQDVFSNAVQQMIVNSPGELKYRIDQLEKKVGINSDNKPTSEFVNIHPN